MELRIVTSEGEIIEPRAGQHFTVQVMPEKGQTVALAGHEHARIADVGFTQTGADLIATIWLSSSNAEECQRTGDD
jgi:hypothetical protein